MPETKTNSHHDLLALTADIVSVHISHNIVSIHDLPGLICTVHAALAGLGSPVPEEAAELKPAVPVKSSIKPDYIICLEDGMKLKMLKRHLMTHYGLTPEAYRARWNLPANYPMVSPNYSAKRKALALSIGLGRKKLSGNQLKTAVSSTAARPKAASGSPARKARTGSASRRKLGIVAKDG